MIFGRLTSAYGTEVCRCVSLCGHEPHRQANPGRTYLAIMTHERPEYLRYGLHVGVSAPSTLGNRLSQSPVGLASITPRCTVGPHSISIATKRATKGGFQCSESGWSPASVL